jgi:hypothetical protein
MLGVYSGFRRDDDTTTAAATTSSEPAMSDTVAGTSGSVVEEEGPVEENGETAPKSFCRREKPCLWASLASLVVVLILVILLVLILWILPASETNASPSLVQAGGATRTPGMTLPQTPSPSLRPTAPTTTAPSLQPSMFPSSAPTALRFVEIVEQIEGLLQLTVPREDASDPRWKAADWLATQDQVLLAAAAAQGSVTDFRYGRRLAQRFLLAALYYSTGGPDWDDSCLFLEPTLHECDWKCRPPEGGAVKDLLFSQGLVTAGVSCYSFPDFADEMEHLVLGTFFHSFSLPWISICLLLLISHPIRYV